MNPEAQSNKRIVTSTPDSITVQYPRGYWDRGSAWEDLLQDLPEAIAQIMSGAQGGQDVRNPWRRCHDSQYWGWSSRTTLPTPVADDSSQEEAQRTALLLYGANYRQLSRRHRTVACIPPLEKASAALKRASPEHWEEQLQRFERECERDYLTYCAQKEGYYRELDEATFAAYRALGGGPL